MGPLLNLGKVDAGELMDYLYGFFHRDFVARRAYLNGSIWVNPQSQRQEDGKEMSFWHLTSRAQSYQKREGGRYVTVKERLPDYRRSERLEWVRLIIENHGDPRVRAFYHQETNAKNDIRLYLWAHQHDFVVILQKLGRSSSFLVTSFFIDHAGKRGDYQKRFDEYRVGSKAELRGCEWF